MQFNKDETTSNSNINDSLVDINDSINIENNDSNNIEDKKKEFDAKKVEILNKLKNEQNAKSMELSSDIKYTQYYLDFIQKVENIKENYEKNISQKKMKTFIASIYVLSTILLYLYAILGFILFFYASFFIIFTIIMNGFCLMLYHSNHKGIGMDVTLGIMWIFGSTPYVDALVFVNISCIRIFFKIHKRKY